MSDWRLNRYIGIDYPPFTRKAYMLGLKAMLEDMRTDIACDPDPREAVRKAMVSTIMIDEGESSD